jgi:hypothetical protein
MSEEKPVCPRCQSELIQPISNELRCGACGFQFGLVRDPIARRVQAAREARSEKTGYQPHKHGRDG